MLFYIGKASESKRVFKKRFKRKMEEDKQINGEYLRGMNIKSGRRTEPELFTKFRECRSFVRGRK